MGAGEAHTYGRIYFSMLCQWCALLFFRRVSLPWGDKKAYQEILAGFVVSPGTGRNAGDPLSRRRLLASHQVHTTLRPSQTTIRSFTVFLLAQFCFAGKVE